MKLSFNLTGGAKTCSGHFFFFFLLGPNIQTLLVVSHVAPPLYQVGSKRQFSSNINVLSDRKLQRLQQFYLFM